MRLRALLLGVKRADIPWFLAGACALVVIAVVLAGRSSPSAPPGQVHALPGAVTMPIRLPPPLAGVHRVHPVP